MSLKLRYRIDEGINVTEDLGNGYKESIEVIVRGIHTLPDTDPNFKDIINVKLELREGGRRDYVDIFEGNYQEISSHCNLYLPRKSFQKIHSMKTVLIELIAPRTVEFGKRKMYY